MIRLRAVISPTQANRAVFAIVISEKGGAERRETYDRPEISVGRVQGNDLMLPKGNVSKRHARLIFRDGRFIVTDLNSTNGTYVNRRRISQATIVREGDRIYIGDFVLRIELPDGASEPSGAGDQTGSGPVPARQSQSVVDHVDLGASAPAGELEDSSGTSYPKVPGPPRVPTGARLPSGPGGATVEPPPPAASSASMKAASAVEASQPDIVVPPSDAASEVTARRQALMLLVQRLGAALDPRALEGELPDALRTQLESSASEQARALAAEGVLPPGVEADRLARDAVSELAGLGPLEAPMADPMVTEIAIPRFDAVTVERGGQAAGVEPPFTSDHSLRRVLRRLCAQAGAPFSDGERWVERPLVGGARLRASFGTGPSGSTLALIEKPRRVALSLEDLVRSGAVSRAMATFLGACVAARTNIVVVGPRDGGTAAVVSALAGVSGDCRLVALQELEDVAVPALAARVALPTDPAEVGHVVELAARVPDARTLVDASRSEVAAALIEAAGAGATGLVASVHAQTVQRALSRWVADFVSANPGASVAAARELVAASFDVAVEVSKLRDARWRVLRISEIAGVSGDEIQLADVFTFNAERTAAGGSVEGTFNASGAVPRIADELGARGYSLDGALFTRPPSR